MLLIEKSTRVMIRALSRGSFRSRSPCSQDMELEDQSEEHQLSVIQTAACCCDDIALEAEDESSTKTIEWISHELEAPSSASSIKKRFIRWEDMMDVSFASARRELVLDHLDAEISSGQQESDSQRKMVRYHPCGIYGAVVEVQQEGNMGSGESSLEVKVGNMKATATSELRHGGWRETSITCERYVSGRGRMAKYEIVCRFRRRGGAASPSLNRVTRSLTSDMASLSPERVWCQRTSYEDCTWDEQVTTGSREAVVALLDETAAIFNLNTTTFVDEMCELSGCSLLSSLLSATAE